MKKIILSLVFLFISNTAMALEYQWKFVMPAVDNRETAVKVYEVLEAINGVYDIEIDMLRNSVMFFYDDDKTDEKAVKNKLTEAGYEIEKMMVLEEPREGVM